MTPSFAVSPDGMRIAYECCGAGPVLLLLHGGGGSRQEWHAAGYVKRLQEWFTVITMDLRGHGGSAAPLDPAAYAIEKQVQDILGVATVCGADSFTLWGMSYGGKVGRYAAVQSDRVERIALIGTPMGPGVAGKPRQDAIDFIARWPPILRAQQAGTLDLALLSPNDRELLRDGNVPAMLGWVAAMLDWPAVEPADFRCPALWVVGSQDVLAMASFKECEQALPKSNVQVHIIIGLDHEQVFDEIDRVFPTLLAFTQD